MFRLLFKGRKDTTFRPVKSHSPGSKRAQYSDVTLQTLGSGDLKGAVRLPPGEDLNEWLAANTVDFFNELSLIWGIICDIGIVRGQAGSGFPPGFEYRWADGRRFSSPTPCSGSEYIDYVMVWVEKEINNETLFPTTACELFSPFLPPCSFIVFSLILMILLNYTT